MVNRDRYLVLNSVNKSNNLPNVIYTLNISPLNIGKYIAHTLKVSKITDLLLVDVLHADDANKRGDSCAR